MEQIFKINPLNHENTDYSRSADLPDVPGLSSYSAELSIGCPNDETSHSYIIFPIWWRENKSKHKDYVVGILRNNKSRAIPVDLLYEGYDPAVPFPHLGYSTSDDAIDDMTDFIKVNIGDAYPDFRSWVTSGVWNNWLTNKTAGQTVKQN